MPVRTGSYLIHGCILSVLFLESCCAILSSAYGMVWYGMVSSPVMGIGEVFVGVGCLQIMRVKAYVSKMIGIENPLKGQRADICTCRLGTLSHE